MSGNWLDLSNTSNKLIRTYVKGFVDMSGGNLLLRNNQIFVNKGDVCIGGVISQNDTTGITTTTRDAANVIICTNDVIGALNANSSVALISANSSTFSALNTFTGGVSVAGNPLTCNTSLYVANDVSLNGRLFVGGSDNSFNGNVFVGGQTTIAGPLITSSDCSINGRLVVQGDVSLNRNLVIVGNISLPNSGTHTISGNVVATTSICGTSTVNGSETIAGTETVTGSLSVSGNITINGNLDLTGAVIVGPVGVIPTTTTVIDLSTGYYNNNWAAVAGLPSSEGYRDISISTTGQYILVAGTGNAYVSSSYGKSWVSTATSTITGLPGGSLTLAGYQRACVSSTGQYMLVSSDQYGIYYSTNYGQTWSVPSGLTVAATYQWSGAAISSTGQYMLVCYYPNGSVYLSSNYGQTFTANPGGLGTAANYQYVSMSSTGQYMLISNQNAVAYAYMSSDYGSTFTTSSNMPSGLSTGSFVASSISSTGQYMLLSTQDTTTSRVYRSTNYGLTWTVPAGLPTGATFYSDVCVSANGQYMMACYRTGGNVYYSSDYGATWATNTSIPNTGNTATSLLNYYAVAMSSTGQYMMAAAYSGAIYFSKPPTVTRSTTVINGLVTGTDLSMNGNLYTNMMSTSVVPMTRTYTAAGVGRKWQMVTSGLLTVDSYRNISMNSTGQYMLALTFNSTTGQAYLSTNYGKTFSSLGLPNLGYMCSCISETGQYMLVAAYSNNVGYNGTTNSIGTAVYLSSNYGVTFNKIPSLSTPSTAYNGVSMSATGQYMLAGAQSVSVLWRSADYGQTWLSAGVASDAFIANAVSGTGQYMVAIMVAAGRNIWTSSNYGVTWASKGFTANDYRDISISSTGQYILASTDATLVYLSSNYGQNYNAVGTFTGAQGVSVSSTGQYMLVGTSSGAISLSTNYGASWTSVGPLGSYTVWHCAISANGQYMLASTTDSGLGSVYLSKTTDLSYSTISTNIPYMNIKGYVGFSDMSSSYINPAASAKALVEINGTSGTTGSNIDAYSLYTSGSILSGQNLVVASDRRIKTNIVDVVDVSAMSVIQQLKPKRYNYIDVKNRGEAPVWGFIAQEVGEVLDYAVNKTSAYIPNVYKSAVVDGYRVTCVGVKQKMEGASNLSVDLSTDNLSANLTTDLSANLSTDLSANFAIDSSVDVSTDLSANVIIDLSANFAIDSSVDISTDLSANFAIDLSDNLTTDVAIDLSDNLTTDVAIDLSDNLTTDVATDSTPNEGFERSVSAEPTLPGSSEGALRETMGFPSTLVSLLNSSGQTIYATIDSWIDDDSFMVKEWLSDGPEDWFLYGQLVHDFNALDKMAIYTIATAALQEFDTEFQETRRHVAQLKARLNMLLNRGNNNTVPVTEPIVETIVEPVTDSVTEPIIETTVEPLVEPIVESVLESVMEQIVEPIVEPVPESIVEPVVDSVTEPIIETIVEPLVEPIVESVLESVMEPIVEPIVEQPVTEPMVEPIVEQPVTEQIVEPIVEQPVTEPIVEPIVKQPVTEPIVEPIVEPTTEPIVEPTDTTN